MYIQKLDPLYKSYWFLKFINKLFKAGKRSKMLHCIYNINLLNKDLDFLFFQSLDILRVSLSIKKISKKYNKPFFISEYYQNKQSIKWIVNSIFAKKNIKTGIFDELKSIVCLDSDCLSLKQKKNHEFLIYKNRRFKNFNYGN